MWFTKSRRAQSDSDYETWIQEGVSPTLNAFDNTGDSRATVLIAFDNSYRDGLRIQKGETINTLSAKMGTGGNNVPMIAIPIDIRNAMRDPEKLDAMNRQGLGIGKDGEPSHTITSAFVPGVAVGQAIPIQGTIIGRQDHNGPQGKGFGEPGDPMFTLDRVSQHGVEHQMQVRRLTPIECERLMGWPDDHTLYRADGKTNADSTRYKMCGNGVASPVARWIGEQIMKVNEDE